MANRRILTVGPTATDLIEVLGLPHETYGADETQIVRSKSIESCPFAPLVADHANGNLGDEWSTYLQTVKPDVVVADVSCGTCIGRDPLRVRSGPPVLIAIGRPPLAECLDLLVTVGAWLGVEALAQREYTQRSARLLALRMHAARFLVRTPDARRPVAAAVVRAGKEWRVSEDRRIAELIDATGCLAANLPAGTVVTGPDLKAAHIDALLAGSSGARTTTTEIAKYVDELTDVAPSVWHADWDALLGSSGPSVVESVEYLLRATFPKALGTNGTPPPSTVLRRAGAVLQ